jgi:hypothetical protein
MGGLQLFRGGVIYNITIASDSSDTAWAVIETAHASFDVTK